MRLTPAFILLAAGSMLAAAPAEAKTGRRADAINVTRIANPPAHGMSALAQEQARRRQVREQQRFGADDGAGVRFGAFRRDYSLTVSRPAVRPDQDGAVGFSWRMKTRD